MGVVFFGGGAGGTPALLDADGEFLASVVVGVVCGDALVDVVAADGGGAEDVVAEFVGGYEVEFFAGGFVDEGGAFFVGGIDVAVGEYEAAAEGATESGFPEFGAGGGVPADGDSGVEDGEECILVEQHGGDVGAGIVFPCEFAGTISEDSGDVIFGVAAAGEDAFAISDGGGDAFGGGAGGFPKGLAGGGIEAGDEVAAGDDELFFSGGVNDDGGGVIGFCGAIAFPDDLASFAVHGDDGPAAFVIGDADDEVFVEEWGGAEALVVDVGGEACLPELFAIEIDGVHVDGVGVEEVDKDALAVAGWGCGGHAGFFVAFDIEAVFVEDRFPELFAGAAIEAQQ